MPVGVEILIRLNERPSDDQLQSWRERALREFSSEEKISSLTYHGSVISVENDSFSYRGPLIYVEDWVPFNDEEGVWLNLNLMHAYYGLNYERGDIKLFVRCAEWIEANLPNCQVFYGSDASDSDFVLFDVKARRKLLRYYELVGRKPYLELRHDKEQAQTMRTQAWQQVEREFENLH